MRSLSVVTSGLQVIGQRDVLAAVAWHLCFGGAKYMFWTLYDPIVKREPDGQCSPVHVHQPRQSRQAAPQTAETVLFLIEDTSKITDDKPTALLN